MNKAQKIAYISVLSAMSLIANIFSIQLSGSNYLSFVYFVCFVSGIFFGPLIGGAVGFFGDTLGALIAPKGAFNPLILIATVLLGVIPALVWKYLKCKEIWKLLVALFVCAVVCTAGLNTFALWFYFSSQSKTFFVYLFGRLPWQLLMVAVNGILIFAVLKIPYFKKLLKDTSGGFKTPQ